MTKAFPYHEDCYTWPRVGVVVDDGVTELNVHCLCHPGRKQFYCVGFIGVDREEQIGQVAELARSMGAEVKIIKGIGFTDEIINGLMAAMEEPDPQVYPGQTVSVVPVDWPNKTQRRVLRKLHEATTPGDSFHETRLAKRLHMPVEEVRRDLQVLANIGLVEEER